MGIFLRILVFIIVVAAVWGLAELIYRTTEDDKSEPPYGF